MCSEIETLDITEAEERAGLRRVFDLVGELPIPPDKTRKLAGYIARIEAQVATLTQERDFFASQVNVNAGGVNVVSAILAERDEARAAAEAMSRPVSDPEWERLIANSNADEDNEIWETIYRSDVNALIAARVRDSKEADNGKNGR
jgi:hypothetical protein